MQRRFDLRRHRDLVEVHPEKPGYPRRVNGGGAQQIGMLHAKQRSPGRRLHPVLRGPELLGKDLSQPVFTETRVCALTASVQHLPLRCDHLVEVAV